MNLLGEACKYLKSCGIEHPDHDVRLMAAFAAARPLRTALGDPPPDFTPPQEAKFRRLVARRGEQREPVAYLLESEEFMGLELRVTPSVLIPRPSTETLVERTGTPGSFLEIGTGSGAVAIALARAGSRGTATDLSPRAIEIARENARRHGVEDRLRFIQADLFAPGDYDVVVSNPPYVSTAQMALLPPEVLREPRLALEGGPEGLDVIQRIVAGARAHAPRLLLEIGSTQAPAVRVLALQAGYLNVQIHRDLDGHDRVLEAT